MTDQPTRDQAKALGAQIPVSDNEEWRTIHDYADYEVSSFGRIRRAISHPCHPKLNIKKLKKEKNGYMRIGLTKDGKQRFFYINRLVALAFLGEPPSDTHQAAHCDGNRQNNHWRNLRWATQSENEGDKIQHGTSPHGEGNGRSKLTAKQVLEIRKIYSHGGISQKELGDQFRISRPSISEIVRGEKWIRLEAK